jgi:hypothetical protein
MSNQQLALGFLINLAAALVVIRGIYYPALLIANVTIALVLYAGEKQWGCHYDQRQSVTYERIELIRPENHERLLADLRERTGLPVTRFEIGRIDFLRDVAELQVYYRRDPASLPQSHSLSPTSATASE